MSSPSHRVALVTGANRGIGLAVSEQLARSGYRVLLSGRDRSKCGQSAEGLQSKGLDVQALELDVTDARSITVALGRIKDEQHRLDILINNAGIMLDQDSDILDMPLTILQNTLKTNAFGPLLLSQGCVEIMQAHMYGRIVNVSSMLGSLTDIVNPESAYAQLQSPAYRLSKVMLNGITTLLARELRDSNILVNSVCPGWVRTALGGPHATRSPTDAAETIVWLATLPDGGPTGGFFRDRQPIPW